MTGRRERAVIDTNIVMSGLIFRASNPRLAVVRAFQQGVVLSCPATRNELREVGRRDKFDRYVPLQQRIDDIEELIEDMEPVEIRETVRVCADPKDDKFLELAVNGNADLIITGDDHLLRLNPFRRITILAPLAYLER